MTPRPLYHTFGNHMHWVDMQWLWGYSVLPSSIRDMLALCAATGARGNVNFDGIGYEKLAAECPAALEELREALRAGRVEVVGGSYGQPYGLFHGGESAVRQRVLGVRACERVLGVRPTGFWEEEFDFYPQLPQILAACGFRTASLFFQWTWHTPTVPLEETPLVLWQGVDGTRLPALARTELCLHQWPEDFDGRLEGEALARMPRPALVQWLELLPSPDWMCRSEVLLPRLRELFADPRFELRPRTLTPLVEELAHELGSEGVPVRAYSMDDVFHGMSLGKNGDHMVRRSHAVESTVLAAESLLSALGLHGRPYASWDVYPTWELDEAWRELCAAQHHDNHECEGLCGSVGERSFDRAEGLASDVLERGLELLTRRVPAQPGEVVVVNPSGWPRDVHVGGLVARDVPAFGWAVVGEQDELVLETEVEEDEDRLRLARGASSLTVCRHTGLLLELTSREEPRGLALGRPLGELRATFGGVTERFEEVRVRLGEDEECGDPVVVVERGGEHGEVELELSLARSHDALRLLVRADLDRPDGGMNAGLTLGLPFPRGCTRVRSDTPYAVGEVRADGTHRRKYPSGDWMTSEQWFETVEHPLTGQSLFDLVDEAGAGLLVAHDGSQQAFRDADGLRLVLDLYDPWDERHHRGGVSAHLALLAHGPLRDSTRWRLARELAVPPFARPVLEDPGPALERDLPRRHGPLRVHGEGVLCTALLRETNTPEETRGLDPEVRNPHVLRLVEFDGRPARVVLELPGPAGRVARTDLLGRVTEELRAETDAEGVLRVALDLRPHEIATVMADLVPGRHQPRHLDRHRKVWATVHREG